MSHFSHVFQLFGHGLAQIRESALYYEAHLCVLVLNVPFCSRYSENPILVAMYLLPIFGSLCTTFRGAIAVAS
jgi:hypothetical protein